MNKIKDEIQNQKVEKLRENWHLKIVIIMKIWKKFLLQEVKWEDIHKIQLLKVQKNHFC